MVTTHPLHKDLKALGQRVVPIYEDPNPDVLETFPTPLSLEYPRECLQVSIDAEEFTSLCPRTGQPDFAQICIDYEPSDRCLESKSLKLYLGRYRGYQGFAEAIVVKIGEDLRRVLEPNQIQVRGYFSVRGGISFNPTYQWP